MSHWCLNVYTETNAAVPDLAWGLLALSLHKYALLVKAYLIWKGEQAVLFCVFPLTPLILVIDILGTLRKSQELKEQLDGCTERENEAPLLYPYANKETAHFYPYVFGWKSSVCSIKLYQEVLCLLVYLFQDQRLYSAPSCLPCHISLGSESSIPLLPWIITSSKDPTGCFSTPLLFPL